MENILNVFENPAILEPKCPKCDSRILLGVTTRYSQRYRCHVCLKCGGKLL